MSELGRRAFLASLGLAPIVARSYFDIGAAWQRHASGLVVPRFAFESVDLIDVTTHLDTFRRFAVRDVARVFNVPERLLRFDR